MLGDSPNTTRARSDPGLHCGPVHPLPCSTMSRSLGVTQGVLTSLLSCSPPPVTRYQIVPSSSFHPAVSRHLSHHSCSVPAPFWLLCCSPVLLRPGVFGVFSSILAPGARLVCSVFPALSGDFSVVGHSGIRYK